MNSARRIRRALAFLAVLLAAGLFQAWFMGLSGTGLTHRIPSGSLVDAYADALAHGRAHLNEAHLDASYFEGRYYVYYGIGPFALLLAPWRAVTGTFLSPGACILAALLCGYAAYGWALWRLLRDAPGLLTDLLLPAGLLTLIAASGTMALMDLPNIHQLESSWAFASSALAVACLVAARERASPSAPVLALASFFSAFILTCRPSCLPGVVVLAALIGREVRRRHQPGSAPIRPLLAIASPFAAVAVLLAAWNWARFGSVWQTGMSYGSGIRGRPDLGVYSAGSLAYNLDRYLIGGIRWGLSFPFIEGMAGGPIALPSSHHEAFDQVYGCLVLFPILLFAVLALRRWRTLSGALLLAGLGNLVVLGGLGFGTYRYPPDFLGFWSFIAALGLGSLAMAPHQWPRRMALAALAPLLAWSAAMALCEAASISQVHRLLDQERPRDFARLARPFDALAYRFEAAAGFRPRSIRLQLMLPRDKSGRDEPLVVYGEPGLEDFIYVYYAGPGSIRLGFESMGRGGPVSGPIPVDYAKPHTLDIVLGCLLPLDDHPLVQKLGANAAQARSHIHLALDGRTVLDCQAAQHPPRSRFFWGRSPDDAAFGTAFTGSELRVERPPLLLQD